MIAETAGLGAADIALLEIAEGKLAWEIFIEEGPLEAPVKKRRKL